MNEAEHLVETRRWLRYAREDFEGAETLLEHRVVVPLMTPLQRMAASAWDVSTREAA